MNVTSKEQFVRSSQIKKIKLNQISEYFLAMYKIMFNIVRKCQKS